MLIMGVVYCQHNNNVVSVATDTWVKVSAQVSYSKHVLTTKMDIHFKLFIRSKYTVL